MSDKKIKIAITGSIGSGKSLFSKIAEENGYTVIKSDEVSKEILFKDEHVKKEVLKEFGINAYLGKTPNLTHLAEVAFNDPEKLRKLEKLLHPKVLKNIEKASKELFKTIDVVFIETALVYEADIEDEFDFVVLVTADRDVRQERKMKNGMRKEDFEKRELNQIPDDEKRKRADFIFLNNGSIDELKAKFNLLKLTLSI